MKIGDLVMYRDNGLLGVVMSEVFDFRPKWHAEYPAVEVVTRHAHTGEEGVWTWLLEDIKVVSTVDGTI
jgi:hypothetical protein